MHNHPKGNRRRQAKYNTSEIHSIWQQEQIIWVKAGKGNHLKIWKLVDIKIEEWKLGKEKWI